MISASKQDFYMTTTFSLYYYIVDVEYYFTEQFEVKGWTKIKKAE